jgi:phosphoglycerate dehydrogenase-like enzyme
LDVVTTEPLPESHPFWNQERVFITPHVSGVTPGFWKREIELITDNIERYLNGRPLRNIVDLEAGY